MGVIYYARTQEVGISFLCRVQYIAPKVKVVFRNMTWVRVKKSKARIPWCHEFILLRTEALATICDEPHGPKVRQAFSRPDG